MIVTQCHSKCLPAKNGRVRETGSPYVSFTKQLNNHRYCNNHNQRRIGAYVYRAYRLGARTRVCMRAGARVREYTNEMDLGGI